MFNCVPPLDVKLHEGSGLFCFIIVNPEAEIIILGTRKVMNIFFFNKDINDWQNKEQICKELMKKRRYKTNVMEHR